MADHRRRERPGAEAAPISRGSTHTRLTALTLAALTAIALLGALTGLSGCAGSSQGGAALAPTPTVPATPEGRLTQRVRQAEGAAAQSVTLTYNAAAGTVDLMVTLKWSPSWKTDFAAGQAAAKVACYKAQNALWTSGASLSNVTVTILGQVLDDYGEVITGAYAAVTLTSARASTIPWPTTTADDAWSRYDTVFLRPLYGSDWMYPHPPAPTAAPAS